jgi:hypothetical protein
VVTTASLAQPRPDSSGQELAVKMVYCQRSLLVGG